MRCSPAVTLRIPKVPCVHTVPQGLFLQVCTLRYVPYFVLAHGLEPALDEVRCREYEYRAEYPSVGRVPRRSVVSLIAEWKLPEVHGNPNDEA